MMRSGLPLSELARRAMDRVPQVLENVRLPARRSLDEMKKLAAATEKVKRALGHDGRVLVRWSGTEPKLRVMIEGPDESRIRAWALDLVDAAKRDMAIR
jgi:phosphoglucosamine mutase